MESELIVSEGGSARFVHRPGSGERCNSSGLPRVPPNAGSERTPQRCGPASARVGSRQEGPPYHFEITQLSDFLRPGDEPVETARRVGYQFCCSQGWSTRWWRFSFSRKLQEVGCHGD
jgi:hypothetical protein